jgi:hypothetical protein
MRKIAFAFMLCAITALAAVPGLPLRGKLVQADPKKPDSKKPALELAGHHFVYLSGDEPTIAVLNDPRLAGTDFEAIGHFNAPDQFEVDPIHKRSMFVYKNGQRRTISYWCDVCYIRTYSPGNCWCCQKWTDLDLRDPDAPDQ